MIWPLSGLKNDYDTVNFKKSHMTSFYGVIKIRSPKMRHQNDITKFFIFKLLP